MSAADPLEEWRAIQEAEWERIVNNEQVYGWEHHTAERLEKENRLLAAWEKEREHGFGRSLEATTSIARRHEVLRAEVLKIAEEAEAEASHCRQPYMARLNGVAERLRKACE